MKYLFNLQLFLYCIPLFSQTLTGTIKDSISGEVLPYVNMTLLSKNIGATTNENGEYYFDAKGNTNDSLLVSYMGYASKKFSLQEFENTTNNTLEIVLTESKQQIDEVILKVKKTKYTAIKKIGIEKKLIKFGMSVPFGFENCVLMKNPSFKEGKVNSLTLFFKKKEDELYEVLPTYFRLKFYEYDPKFKQPGKLLSYEQIILQPENKTQKIKIDLKEYHIKYPRNGICVGVETFNPGKKRDSKIMYLTSPNLKFTYDDESLTWYSFKGKVWNKNEHKLRSNLPFSRKKASYSNPLIHLDVQFKK